METLVEPKTKKKKSTASSSFFSSSSSKPNKRKASKSVTSPFADEGTPTKKSVSVLPAPIQAFLRGLTPNQDNSEQISLTPATFHGIVNYLDKVSVDYQVVGGSSFQLDDICAIFMDAFLHSTIGILLSYPSQDEPHKQTLVHLDSLAQFNDMVHRLRGPQANETKILWISLASRINVSRTIEEVRAKILNRMISQTADTALDKSIFQLMKLCQLWAWWGTRFATELVFIIAKLLYAEEAPGEPITNVPNFLTQVFTNHHHSYAQPLQFCQVPLHLLLNPQLNHQPSSFQLVFDPTSDPISKLQQGAHPVELASVDGESLYNSTVIHILHQSANNGSAQLLTTSPLEKHHDLKRLKGNHELHSLSVTIPLGFYIFMVYNPLLSSMRLWHNILHAHVTRMSGHRTIEKWNQTLNSNGKLWYKNLTAHQDIFKVFMDMTPTKLASVFDRSYTLALNLSTGIEDSNNWILSFLDLLLRRDQTMWSWPSFEPTSGTVKDYLNQVQTLVGMDHLWNASTQRALLTHTFAKGSGNYYWDLVYQPEHDEVRLISADTPWWKKPNPETEELYMNNGCQTRDVKLHSIEKPVLLRSQKRILNCEEQDDTWLFSKETNANGQRDILHLLIQPPTSSSSLLNRCSWLPTVLLDFFGRDLPLSFSLPNSRGNSTLQSLFSRDGEERMAAFLRYVYQKFYVSKSTSSDLLLTNLLFANNPEYLPLPFSQILLHSFHEFFLSEGTENGPLVLHSQYAPYIPHNSIGLDTWAYLMSSDYSTSIADTKKPDALLMILKSGAWLVVELECFYGITFAARVLYQSPLLEAEQGAGRVLTHVELANYLQHSAYILRRIIQSF
jgi:hypothetical protein